MLDTLQYLIGNYGYLAVFIGCFFEGEAAVLLGILAAHREILNVQGVVIAAIIGTILGDNLWFHVGRHAGRRALDRRPRLLAKAARVEILLHRYGAPVMIGFRFFYGLRYITPFVLGSLGVSPWRFLLLESMGTLIWANIVAFIGVYLADAILVALAHIRNFEQALVVILIAITLIAVIIYRRRRKRPNDRLNR